MNTKPHSLIIFDCDGVLVESEELTNDIYCQMFAEYGYPLDVEETLREFHGVTMPARIRSTSQKIGWTPPENFIPIFNDRFHAQMGTGIKPIPGIRAIIESLTVPICVASNGTREEILLRLKIIGLTERFTGAIFSGMEMPHPKPAPDVYLAAAKAFNVPPSSCIVIEDSILGVTAAVRAGMKVYGHATYNSPKSLHEAGAIPFDNMPELQAILYG